MDAVPTYPPFPFLFAWKDRQPPSKDLANTMTQSLGTVKLVTNSNLSLYHSLIKSSKFPKK
jgi:hypothetical protein